MPMHWKLVSYEVDDDEMERVRLKAAEFPPGVLDNVPTDFLFRATWSSQVQGCVVLCYQDGREPDINSSDYYGGYPTYKGMHGKRIAMIGKTGSDPGKGTVVLPTCNNRLCINQQHLKIGGTTRNQYTKTAEDEETDEQL